MSHLLKPLQSKRTTARKSAIDNCPPMRLVVQGILDALVRIKQGKTDIGRIPIEMIVGERWSERDL
jgi:hypothetical protein